MKKFLALVMTFIITFTFIACKNNNGSSSNTSIIEKTNDKKETTSKENTIKNDIQISTEEIKKLINEELNKIGTSSEQPIIDEQKLISDVTNNVLEQLSNRDKFVAGEEVSSLFGAKFEFPFDSYYNSKGLNETAKIKSFKIVKLSENTNKNYREWEEIGGGVKFVRYKYKVSVKGAVSKKHSGSKIQIWLSEDDFAEYSNYSPRVTINTDGSFSIEWISCSNKNINQTAIENIFVDSKEDEVT